MNTSKIIRRFPLPEVEMTEEEFNRLSSDTFQESKSEPAKVSMMSNTLAATSANTKPLNYTADQINTKLAHTYSYATTSHTYNSYIQAVSIRPAATGTSRVEANYLVIPYGDYINDISGDTSIVNVKLLVKDGVVKTFSATCISGKIDPYRFEVLMGVLKANPLDLRIFIKSNGFRGTIVLNELSLNNNNAGVYYSYSGTEYQNIVPQWNLYSSKYSNIASEVAGVTPWVINYIELPTSTADLFIKMFGADNIRLSNSEELFNNIQSGHTPSVVLNSNLNNAYCTSIAPASEVNYIDNFNEIEINLEFMCKAKYYQISFRIDYDGYLVDNSASATIKNLV